MGAIAGGPGAERDFSIERGEYSAYLTSSSGKSSRHPGSRRRSSILGQPPRRCRLALSLLAVALAWCVWWWTLPRTPEELFRARCSSCHELPDLCPRTPLERVAIVATMRSQHGAAEAIDNDEARIIVRYLKTELKCP